MRHLFNLKNATEVSSCSVHLYYLSNNGQVKQNARLNKYTKTTKKKPVRNQIIPHFVIQREIFNFKFSNGARKCIRILHAYQSGKA